MFRATSVLLARGGERYSWTLAVLALLVLDVCVDGEVRISPSRRKRTR
jgi:hypothetical protein